MSKKMEQQKAEEVEPTYYTDGRVTRLRFFVYSLYPVFLLFFILLKKEVGHEDYGALLLFLISYFVMSCWMSILAIPRWHDLNLSGHLSWLMLIGMTAGIVFFPPLIFIILLALYFFPGAKAENKYGVKALKNTRSIKIQLGALLAAFVILWLTDDSFQRFSKELANESRIKASEAIQKRSAPLSVAIEKKYWNKVEQLIAEGSQLDKVLLTNQRTPLHLLLFTDDSEIIHRFVPRLLAKMAAESKDCDQQDTFGVTPLMLATSYGQDIFKPILSCGVKSINQQNQNGNTALHYVALEGDAEIAKVLIQRGADPTIKNKAGETALQSAHKAESVKLQLFLESLTQPLN